MTRKKRILIVGAAVLVVGAAGATAYLFRDYFTPPPNPETAKPEEVTHYLASEKFARLPVEKKQVYMQKLRRNTEGNPRRMMRTARNLPEKERQKLRENIGSVFRARMEQAVDRYFELPPEQRTAYLDEMIDRHEQFRRERQARRAAGENERPREGRSNDQRRRRPGGRRGRRTPERHKRRIKRISGERRARMTEFMEAMRKRRRERGLPDRRGPGRRR